MHSSQGKRKEVVPPVKDPRELFIHELQDTYDAEHRVKKMLPKLAQEAQHDELRAEIEHHEEETETQIENLDKIFELLGEKGKATPCAGMRGLEEEHKSFLEEDPSPEILEMFDVSAGQKVEQYEICSYNSLIEMAQLLGEKDVVPLLKENLKHEEEMFTKLQQLSKQLGKETVREAVAV
jgi:ferritin-like metal-binding protein YciE